MTQVNTTNPATIGGGFGAATPLPATGRIVDARDGIVVFNPAGTSYRLYLAAPRFTGEVGRLTGAVVRVRARKIWTVPSGGNFVAPILGTPRTIQGRVRALDERGMIVHAGVNIHVEFPADDSAFDLANGPLFVGTLVNVTALPGASVDLVALPTAGAPGAMSTAATPAGVVPSSAAPASAPSSTLTAGPRTTGK